VPEIPTDATLIVIFGSRNDVATSSEVEIAANAMFDAVQVQAPSARVLVVGPAWITSDPPDNLLASDDGLAAAAGAHGFDFVSALDAGVLADRADLIGEDGVHPNDAGHAVLAGFISPLVAERVAG
jgi:lysophospholipase L1-like esterase